MAVVAVICARGGSKGIPRKNVRPFHGHPLIVWTIRAAMACTRIEHVVLSSDDDEILAVAEAAGALPHRRPAELATDEAGTEPCVIDIDGLSVGLTICEDIWHPEPAAQAKEIGRAHV